MSQELDTAPTPADRKGLHSRRAVIGSAVAVGAGATAAIVARPEPASAADNDPLYVGGSFSSPDLVGVTVSSSANNGIVGNSSNGAGVVGNYTGSIGGNNGVLGQDESTGGGNFGVAGTSANNVGVYGNGPVYGVEGATTSGVAVIGFTTSGVGVSGNSNSADGVEGITGTVASLSAPGQSGVAGFDNSETTGAFGVSGSTTRGTGVGGVATNGTGVQGTSASGTGVSAASSAGIALAVSGKVTFSGSGLATVAKKSKSVTVTLAGVTTSSMILATLQQGAGTVTVASVVPGSGSFTINLTGGPSSAVQVAYFVIG